MLYHHSSQCQGGPGREVASWKVNRYYYYRMGPPRYLHTRYLHTTNKISVTRRGAPYQVKYFKCILSGSLKFLSQFIVRNDVYTLSMGPWYRWLYTDIYTLTVCISSWYQVIIRTCSWIFGVLGKIPPNISEYLCRLCIFIHRRGPFAPFGLW